MHDIRLIRENPAAFDAGLASRGLEPLAAHLLDLDDRRKASVSAAQDAQERRNALSKEIGAAKKAKDEARAQALMAEVARLKEDAPDLEKAEKAADEALRTALAEIPNIPAADVPLGQDETGNVLRHDWGKPVPIADAKEHFEIGEAWRVGNGTAMDFEIAAKLSGSRFVVLRGQLARLERALGQFMIDLHTNEHGYIEASPPLLVRDDVMFGTAQLPKFRDDQFRAIVYPETSEERSALQYLGLELHKWLIPTAEVPLTNLVRESILSEDELPLRFAALTPCFRAEAGAAGRDTRGMLRQHQFTKCELVSITAPEKSAEEHERMLACAEAVLQKLELPYRVMTLCTGDMGFASQKTYDIEVWMPGQGTFREISSCSVCGDFQARRMDARYRPKEAKGPRHVHTLNGSGVAVGRALIAVLENYQQPDGSVVVPAALRPYMGGLERLGAA
ncbi:serine--tRNA ligase [Enterovirga rhinocerotis]|uniref:Serine--tRNA ligase n=1 Tax=Enterovirga rhinocerotis TaxID=1339210 RepID=A0A4R7C6B7_9HYPH|nr:serine--tRNA ligase [Enterovirga rhinocerotis]TDR94124.1 seryl-tRNA synthetase [Enterovirga rhinocerotis]